jgi:hypothetical protein
MQSGLNAVYSARTSLTSLRFGVNALNALNQIKLINVVESEGSSGGGSSGGGSTGGSGEF